MILGLHCPVRAGHLAALSHAEGLGCGAMQLFSYRRHQEPAAAELEAFRAARVKSPVKRLFVHVRFLPFLASADEERHLHSGRLLKRELELAAALGAEGLVVHAGAYPPGGSLKAGLERFADGATRASEASGVKVPLLLENVPGGGRRMGGSLEELAELAGLLERRGIETGFCLDTAHAWAQGYDLSSAEAAWKFLGRVHRTLGTDRVRLFHLNDSRALLASRREDHRHWGEGRLGLEGVRLLLSRPEYADTPAILETPPGERERENLDLLRSLQQPVRG